MTTLNLLFQLLRVYIYIKSFRVFLTTSTAPLKVLFIVTFSCIT